MYLNSSKKWMLKLFINKGTSEVLRITILKPKTLLV